MFENELEIVYFSMQNELLKIIVKVKKSVLLKTF